METSVLADLIVYIRTHRIKQKDLALAAGTSQSFVSQAIAGERRFSGRHIKKIRRRFPQMPERLFKLAA